MRRRDKAGGKAVKAQRLKRGNASKSTRPLGKDTNVAQLKRERDEALEQQRATSEVLKVISSSRGEPKPVFKKILESALRICEAEFGMLMLHHSGDGSFDTRVMVGAPPALVDALLHQSFTPPPGNPLHRMLRTKKTVHVIDAAVEKAKPLSAQLAGARSHISVPMVKQNEVVGAISVYRTEVRPFTDRQIELVTNFAAQAVIAIENARLFNETREALAHQTAASEVLQTIGSSMADAQPVFERILDITRNLVGSDEIGILLASGDGLLHMAAHCGTGLEAFKNVFPMPIELTAANVVMVEQRQRYFPDALNDQDAPPSLARAAEVMGNYSCVITPMIWERRSIGVISVAREPNAAFTDKELGLLRTFADQAVIAIQNTRLFNETREALERQTATADILKVIASSPSDVQPVFEAIAERANRLVEGLSTGVYRLVDDTLHLMAFTRISPQADAVLEASYPRPLSSLPFGEQIRRGELVHVRDAEVELAEVPALREMAQQRGWRSSLLVTLLRDRTPIGVISVTHKEPGTFAAHHVQLLQTFADQAVIAIENVRLFNETQEALERQTATSEVLKVISSSPGDLAPVFDKMLENATRICGAEFGSMVLVEGDKFRSAALYNAPPAFVAARANRMFQIHPRSLMADAIRGRQVVQVDDVRSSPAYLERSPMSVQLVELGGARTIVVVPMLRDDEVIGAITVYRQEVRPFGDKQIDLLTNFARQAVIAIENARLLRELRQRTDDLSEALVFQTGSSSILKVIASSPTDVGPALKAIVDSAREICEAYDAAVVLKDGKDLLVSAHHGPIPPGFEKAPINRNWVTGRAVADKAPQHVHDLLGPEGDDFPEARQIGRRQGYRTVLSVPLLREGEAIGAIALRRTEVNPFTDKQIALLQTFADQAVIAIENARLFNETKEALERQTATADILKVIASSPDDVQPVFQTIAERSNQLVDGLSTAVLRLTDDVLHLMAYTSVSSEADAALETFYPKPLSALHWGESVRAGKIFVTMDVENDAAAPPEMRALARLRGWRSVLFVPLLYNQKPIGAISATRKKPGAFADNHVQLMQTFADQAVIAIQNARMFEQLQAKTRDLTELLQQQTATADVLKVISRSAFDLDTVMNTLASSARDLCASETASLFLREGDMLVCRGNAAVQRVHEEFIRANPVPLNDELHIGRAVLTGTIANIGDFENNPHTRLRKFQQIMGFKSFLAVPLMREGRGVGVFTLSRDELGPFSERQVELVQGFADQAVIAIENTRLFNETTQALEQQTATADILKVIASSPDDVQPVFEAIAERSKLLVGGLSTSVTMIIDDMFHLMALTPVSAEADAALKALFPAPLSMLPDIDLILRGETVRIADIEDPNAPPAVREMARLRGYRSVLFVPLMRDGKATGTIGVTRVQPGAFADHHVQLMQTFADQAVIAISNVELFRQVQERTRELSQSLDDLRSAQDRLVQTEKLASLGQLTAGIAHEIKNPLNFVNNFSALSVELTDELNEVLKKAELAEKLRQDVGELTQTLKSNLEKVVQHGKRADSIVKNMLLHSREGSREHRPADINSLLDESLNLAYHGARAEKGEFNITLQRDFDADAGTIELFPQEITRAFLNLIANGVYAATRRKTENNEPGFEPTLRATTKNLGTTVEIRIRDNGTGIPVEVQQKMFNPFFTTKPAGEGTGLGLSMTHDIIVKQHGGRIDVVTEPGQFTEFKIVLPRSGPKQQQS